VEFYTLFLLIGDKHLILRRTGPCDSNSTTAVAGESALPSRDIPLGFSTYLCSRWPRLLLEVAR
jgi:hypothetical protein